MGYDVSYHAIDVGLVQDRIQPWVLGRGGDDALDDLIADAMRIRRIRWRAKAWALGARSLMAGDDPFHFIWGRPLFSTSLGSDAVAEDVVGYLGMSTVDDVDAVAMRMIGTLSPSAAATPDQPVSYPGSDDDLRAEVAGGLMTLRAAVAALRAGADTVPGLRSPVAPDRYVPARAAFDIVEFTSALTPGWMDRGPVWPSRLAAEAGVPLAVDTPDPLVDLIVAEFRSQRWDLNDTIVENYSVGGFVAPRDVPAVRVRLAEHRADLLAATDGVALSLTKVDEALALAARLGYAFCEATEIYSGLEGRTN